MIKDRILAVGAEISRLRREADERAALRRLPVMRPYVNLRTRWRIAALIFTPIALAGFCLVYSFFFALTAPYLILAFVTPIAALALLSIWALPDRPNAPTKAMELFFAAALICLIVWPNYLALVLPGLPWITATRLTGTPMALLMLIAFSTSQRFREEIGEVVATIPNLWVWFAAFIGIQFITIATGGSPGAAFSKWIIQQQNWVAFPIVAAWVCRFPGRAERYVFTAIIFSVPLLAIAIKEYSQNALLWLGHIPSFLKIEDPRIASMIYSSITRGATGQYRAKAVFSTPLGLAEYFSLLTPFAIHYAVGKYNIFKRMFGIALLPALFYGVRLTDARLGVLGFLVSVMLYILIWGLMRFRRNRRDLLAATIIYAYPAVFAVAFVAVSAIQPLHVLVFGGGAQEASNAARIHQLVMGIPKIMSNPIGHGGGGAGAAMGYGAGEFVAIDNYYLALGLAYGVIGIVSFLGIFLLTIGWSIRSCLGISGHQYDKELSLLIPISVCLSAFLVIKTVFAQIDLHPLLFMWVGVAAALVWRSRNLVRDSVAAAKDAAPPDGARSKPGRLDDDEDDLGLPDGQAGTVGRDPQDERGLIAPRRTGRRRLPESLRG